MKNIKNWIGYIIYLLLLICYILASHQLIEQLTSQTKMTYKAYPLILGRTIIFILFGMLLGLDYIVREIKKEGKWKINLSKIILIGLPSAYIVTCYLMWLNGISFIVTHFIFILSTADFSTAVDILFGYTVISSFYKVKEDNHIASQIIRGEMKV